MTADVSARSPAGTVAGDFSGITYRYRGVVARMSRDVVGRYLMTFTAADGRGDSVEAEVVRAVGSRRTQQYLTSVDGALWRLPMAFHVEENRWFHMNGAFLTPDPEPAGPEHPHEGRLDEGRLDEGRLDNGPAGTPRFGGGDFDRHVTRWNDNCVFCHNVAPNPGRDPASGAFRTSVAELGIACEACHGPGAAHVLANRDLVGRYARKLLGSPDLSIVNPAHLSPSRSADLCGRCHGQRMTDDIGLVLAHGDPFVPGDDLGLTSAPLWRDTKLRGQPGVFAARFWADGTPRLTAYEYQGLLQSPCAEHGPLTCTSCHGMHEGNPRGQLRVSARGDAVCTSCHAALAAPAEIARHTRHDPRGDGGRCVACHMPKIVYGVLAVHRSHRIEIPDPARDIANGRPDACTLCHVEKGRAWAVAATYRLWPASAKTTARDASIGPRDDLLATWDALFAGDPVARAVAADAMGHARSPSGTAEAAERTVWLRAGALLEVMSQDRYPAIRHLAARALAELVSTRDQSAMTILNDFDATANSRQQEEIVARLRDRLSLPRASGADAARIARLRARAALADIDIGE